MALVARPVAQQLGHAFAQAARGEAAVKDAVKEVWVSRQREGVHVWVVTAPIDMATERRLHQLTGVLYDRFQSAEFQLHILNPRHHNRDARQALPSQAEQIPLR
jgi:1,2-phenylacetyl-CoA epoxidase PaaB subunit